MLNKKNDEKLKLCPFNKMKKCREDCMFFRTGVRYYEKEKKSYPMKDCLFNLIGDNIEAMHQRTYQMQKEVGDTKNVIAFKTLSDLGKVSSAESERIAKKMLNLPTKDQLLIED
jgi:hypothetical protein